MISIVKYVSKYLDSRVIFVLDTLASFISSLIVLIFLNLLTQSGSYHNEFVYYWLGGNLVFTWLMMFISKSYNVIIRHANLEDIRRYVICIFISNLLLTGFLAVTSRINLSVIIAIVSNFLLTVVIILSIRFIMIDVYRFYRSKIKDVTNHQRILVFGISDKSISSIKRFSNSAHYQLIGFISNNHTDSNHTVAGYPVLIYNDESEFQSIIEKYSISAVLFATDADVKANEMTIVKWCANNSIKTLIIPVVDEVIDGKLMKDGIRKVKIEDLLGRTEIKISLDEIQTNFKDKIIMVTGAAGSIGSELCRQLAQFDIKKLVLFDNAETPMHNLRLELEARFPNLDFVPVVGSIRHKDRLDYAFRTWKPQVVFHAAAYKHVPLMEENPCEAVFANVYGSRIVADKCVQYGVDMMVMISTDKAVNPTNIMGCSKRLAEIYVQSLGLAMKRGEVEGKTKFVTTRFGNVLGSNGSVIPRFREQIEHGGPVTVTHPEITRFFMTIPEACRLVMEAATLSSGNQIFVFDMGESVKIADLAKKMIELAGLKVGKDIQIEYTGLRPGEKLYEEVLANSENTDPTSHERIRVAKVREYDYQYVRESLDELAVLSKSCSTIEMVKLMKKIVPEFKSKNSKFEAYD